MFFCARGGGRTHMNEVHAILNRTRIPIPPPGRYFYLKKEYLFCKYFKLFYSPDLNI